MLISVDKIVKRFLSVANFCPVALILLGLFVFLGLDLIWSREITGSTDEIKSHIGVGMILLVMAIIMLMARRKFTDRLWRIVVFTGLLLLGGIFWWDSIPLIPSPVYGIELFVTMITAILMLVVLPYMGRERSDIMIHEWLLYIIHQVMLGAIFSIILAGGLSLAFLAIETLFGASVEGEWYGTIWLISTAVFGGISILDSLVKGDLNESYDRTVHKWKSMLAGVLSILLLLFGGILYAYMIKIVVLRDWPSNEVTFRAFLFAGLVVVSSIILLPLLSWEDEKMYKVRRGLYFALLPICMMVAIAIRQRVEQYSITEKRYYVIASLIWLTGNCIYMITSKRGSVYTLFVSLTVITLLSVFGGPLSARNVSYSAQMERLEKFMSDHDMLTEEGVDLSTDSLSDKAKGELSGMLRYFTHEHEVGLGGLDKRLTDPSGVFDAFELQEWGGYYTQEGVYGSNNEQRKYLDNRSKTPLDISGYTSFYDGIYISEFGKGPEGGKNEDSPEDVNLVFSGRRLTIGVGSGFEENFDLSGLIDQRTGTSATQLGESNSSITGDKIKIFVKSVSLLRKDDIWKLMNIDISIAYKEE